MEAAILLGAPGAGKGTVAEVIRDASSFLHVSTGDMLREAVAAAVPLGRQAQRYMEEGELVPDDVVVSIVTQRLDRGRDDDRYLLDGFPRTRPQAERFDKALEEREGRLRGVFLLEVGQELLVRRLAGRRICGACGAVYHMVNIPPRTEGVCDACGGALYQRQDDTEATVLNRLDVYRAQTEPLIEHYEKKGALLRVDGAGPKETVAKAILRTLAPGGGEA